MNLIYVRKIGYGVRKVDEVVKSIKDKDKEPLSIIKDKINTNKIDNVKLLERILKQVLEELS